jgi:hypothetical protein
MQHGRHQSRQLVPLRFALLWQPLGQLRPDPLRSDDDSIHRCHGATPP